MLTRHLSIDLLVGFVDRSILTRHLSIDLLAGFVGSDRLVRRLSIDLLIGFIGSSILTRHLSINLLVGFVCSSMLIRHLSIDLLFDFVGSNMLTRHLGISLIIEPSIILVIQLVRNLSGVEVGWKTIARRFLLFARFFGIILIHKLLRRLCVPADDNRILGRVGVLGRIRFM